MLCFYRFGWRVRAAILCGAWMLPITGFAQPESDVRALTNAYVAGELDTASLRSKIDSILEAQPDPPEQLRLLLKFIRNLARNLSANRELLSPYLDRALMLPMDASTKAQLLVYRANCYETDPSFTSDRGAQTSALSIYLKDFDLIFSNQKELQRQPLPNVDLFHFLGSKDNPMIAQARAKHERQLAQRNEVESQNQLVELRAVVEEHLVALHGRLHLEESEAGKMLLDGVSNLAARSYVKDRLFR